MNLTNGCSVMDARTPGWAASLGLCWPKTRGWMCLLPRTPILGRLPKDHRQMITEANKSTGFLRVVYTVNKEGGSVYLGVGVAVLFMRNVAGHPPGQGPGGLAQIRTHAPYKHRWHDVSYLGPAHQHAGFGVLVGSWDVRGTRSGRPGSPALALAGRHRLVQGAQQPELVRIRHRHRPGLRRLCTVLSDRAGTDVHRVGVVFRRGRTHTAPTRHRRVSLRPRSTPT